MTSDVQDSRRHAILGGMPPSGNRAPALFDLFLELLKTRIQSLSDCLSDGCSFGESWHDLPPERESGKERATPHRRALGQARQIRCESTGKISRRVRSFSHRSVAVVWRRVCTAHHDRHIAVDERLPGRAL